MCCVWETIALSCLLCCCCLTLSNLTNDVVCVLPQNTARRDGWHGSVDDPCFLPQPPNAGPHARPKQSVDRKRPSVSSRQADPIAAFLAITNSSTSPNIDQPDSSRATRRPSSTQKRLEGRGNSATPVGPRTTPTTERAPAIESVESHAISTQDVDFGPDDEDIVDVHSVNEDTSAMQPGHVGALSPKRGDGRRGHKESSSPPQSASDSAVAKPTNVSPQPTVTTGKTESESSPPGSKPNPIILVEDPATDTVDGGASEEYSGITPSADEDDSDDVYGQYIDSLHDNTAPHESVAENYNTDTSSLNDLFDQNGVYEMADEQQGEGTVQREPQRTLRGAYQLPASLESDAEASSQAQEADTRPKPSSQKPGIRSQRQPERRRSSAVGDGSPADDPSCLTLRDHRVLNDIVHGDARDVSLAERLRLQVRVISIVLVVIFRTVGLTPCALRLLIDR